MYKNQSFGYDLLPVLHPSFGQSVNGSWRVAELEIRYLRNDNVRADQGGPGGCTRE